MLSPTVGHARASFGSRARPLPPPRRAEAPRRRRKERARSSLEQSRPPRIPSSAQRVGCSLAGLLRAGSVRRRTDPAARVAADHPGLAARASAGRSAVVRRQRHAYRLAIVRLAARSVDAARGGARVHARDARRHGRTRRAHATDRLEVAELVLRALLAVTRIGVRVLRLVRRGRARRGIRGTGERPAGGDGGLFGITGSRRRLIGGRRRRPGMDATRGRRGRGPATRDSGRADEGESEDDVERSVHSEKKSRWPIHARQRRVAASAAVTRRRVDDDLAPRGRSLLAPPAARAWRSVRSRAPLRVVVTALPIGPRPPP